MAESNSPLLVDIDSLTTIPHAATRLGLANSSVWRKVQKGLLPAQRVGDQYFIRRADVERLAREREAAAAAPLSEATA